MLVIAKHLITIVPLGLIYVLIRIYPDINEEGLKKPVELGAKETGLLRGL